MKVASASLLAFLALSLGACGGAPSLRSIAYEEFGANAIVMLPHAAPPHQSTPEYILNTYRYVPGALAEPAFVEEERDDIRRRAAVWTVSGGPVCWPTGYQLHQTLVDERPDPIVRNYELEATASLNPFAWFSRQAIRETFFDLKENEFGKLKRVTITLSNIRTYEVGEDELDKSLASIKKRNFCGFRFKDSHVQVRRIIIADVSVVRQSATGIKLATVPLEARHLRRAHFERQGKGMMIVFLPR
ncbi:MAG: hypothetical protein KF807_00165 [Xanthobacteraceae bacterium]|nr:hypothetical protein [Xanthobacteraceae bacterium]